MKKVTGKILKKEDWNVIVIQNGYLHVIHEDDFEHDEFKKLKVGDKVTADSWYKIKITSLNKILKSSNKRKPVKSRGKSFSYLDAPIKIKHKTYFFGSLPDGAVVNGYIIASKGGQHLIYCAKDCFFEDTIDSGCGSLTICVKKGNFYHCKYKNDRSFRGWRNVGEDVSVFYNRFINGKLLDPHYEKSSSDISEKELMKVFRKIDIIELKEARKQLKASQA